MENHSAMQENKNKTFTDKIKKNIFFGLGSIRGRIILGIVAIGIIFVAFTVILVSRLSGTLAANQKLSAKYEPVRTYTLATLQAFNQTVSALQSNVYPINKPEQKYVYETSNKEISVLWRNKTLPYLDSLALVMTNRTEPDMIVVYKAITDRTEKLKTLIPKAINLNSADNRQYLYQKGIQEVKVVEDDTTGKATQEDTYTVAADKPIIAYNEDLAFIISNDIIKIQNELDDYGKQLITFNQRAISEVTDDISFQNAIFLVLSIFIFIALITLLIFAANFLIRYVISDIEKIAQQSEKFAVGEIPPSIYTQTQELNAIAEHFGLLGRNLNAIKKYALSVGEGNFNAEMRAFEGKGNFGESVTAMREGLLKVSEQDRVRSWTNIGLAKFGDILRRESSNIEKLSEDLVSQLVRYTEINQSGIFILSDKKNEVKEEFMELSACYAYDKKKFLERQIMKGQSLVGRVWREGKPIYLTEIPNNYIEIRTGLGGANPRFLFIVPLKLNDEVQGVLELASFSDIEPYKRDFILQVADNIAATFASIKINRRTQLLLDESRSTTAQMREQEEESRQNMEELQATQEEMQRSQRETAEKEGNMKALLDNASDAIMAFNQQNQILVINNAMKRLFESIGVYLDIGKTIEDAFPGRTFTEMESEFKRAFAGERFDSYAEVSVKGEQFYYKVLYNPIYNERQRVIGASVFITNITQQYTTEVAIKIKEANLNSLINNTEDSIVAIDRNYRLTVFNDVYKKRRKEYNCVEGVSVFDFIPESIHQEWKKYYDRALKGERFQKIQKRQDGRKINFREYSFNPILDEKEEVIGLSVFSKDITEAKQAEAENQKIIQNLIEKQATDKEKIKELENQLAKTVE